MDRLININGSSDPAYRYKMPMIVGKIEGRGNGIKTSLSNIFEISDAIARPVILIMKFFAQELGTQSKWRPDSNRGIINGKHSNESLQKLLFNFIRKYVLCPSCNNPETLMLVKKNSIKLKCRACGHRGYINPKYRLCSYISKTFAKSKSERPRKDKKNKKFLKKKYLSEGDKLKTIKEVSVESALDNDLDKCLFTVDLSEEAIAKRQATAKSIINIYQSGTKPKKDDIELDTIETPNSFYSQGIKDIKELLAIGCKDINRIVSLVTQIQIKLNKEPKTRMSLFYEAAFGNNILKQLENEYSLEVQVLKRILSFAKNSSENAYYQGELIKEIERSIGIRMQYYLNTNLLSGILKKMYDYYLLDEDIIQKWYHANPPYSSGGKGSAVRTGAQIMIGWLSSAEVETN